MEALKIFVHSINSLQLENAIMIKKKKTLSSKQSRYYKKKKLYNNRYPYFLALFKSIFYKIK